MGHDGLQSAKTRGREQTEIERRDAARGKHEDEHGPAVQPLQSRGTAGLKGAHVNTHSALPSTREYRQPRLDS